MKKFFLGAAICLLSLAAAAAQVRWADDIPDRYTVKKGDTLWDISNTFLKDPWYWPEIWHVNPQIANPHLIFPGDVLSLMYLDGEDGEKQAVVTVVEPSPIRDQVMTEEEYQEAMEEQQEAAEADEESSPIQGEEKSSKQPYRETVLPDGTVKLSPVVQESAIDNSIPAIPLEAIDAFLSNSRILDNADELANAPYVVAGADRAIISGAGDELFARGEFDEGEKIYGVYRRGVVFQDPETGEVLGIEARDIGAGKLVDLENEIGTIVVNRSSEEIRIGDRLLPNESQRITASYQPSSPPADTNGFIVHVEGGVSHVGKLDIVAINKGRREGIEQGNILAIYKAGEVVRDQVANELVQMPDARGGLMMIFRVHEKMSYGLILHASHPISTGDKVKNP